MPCIVAVAVVVVAVVRKAAPHDELVSAVGVVGQAVVRVEVGLSEPGRHGVVCGAWGW